MDQNEIRETDYPYTISSRGLMRAVDLDMPIMIEAGDPPVSFKITQNEMQVVLWGSSSFFMVRPIEVNGVAGLAIIRG